MNSLKNLLGRSEFHIVLFHVCLILFGWPVVAFQDLGRLKAMFVYLFIAWVVVIFMLYLISRSVEVSSAPEEHESVREEG
jgi:hypothetical protein